MSLSVIVPVDIMKILTKSVKIVQLNVLIVNGVKISNMLSVHIVLIQLEETHHIVNAHKDSITKLVTLTVSLVHLNVPPVTLIMILMNQSVILVEVIEIKLFQNVHVHMELLLMKTKTVKIVPTHVTIVNMKETNVLFVLISEKMLHTVFVQMDTMIMVIKLNVKHVITYV